MTWSAPIYAGCVYAQQHLVVADRRPVDLLESQDILGLAVLVLDDGLHRQ